MLRWLSILNHKQISCSNFLILEVFLHDSSRETNTGLPTPSGRSNILDDTAVFFWVSDHPEIADCLFNDFFRKRNFKTNVNELSDNQFE